MVVTTKNTYTQNKSIHWQKRSPEVKENYGHFDEVATLATQSTISMSSSDDYNLILEEPPRTLHTNNHNQRLKKSNKKNAQGYTAKNGGGGNGKAWGRGNNNNKRGPKPTRVSKATSTKTHDAPMKRRDIYFALDCEMVGVGQDGLDSALARVSIVNWDNEIVLDTYVKVDQPVIDYRTFVSGIRPEQIESDYAVSLCEVRRLVTTMLQGKILIGHGLKNDLKVMGINHPWCDVRDTATYEPFMRTQECRSAEEQTTLCPRKLRDLVREKLRKEIQVMGKAHSPVEDAIAAMDLYKEVRSEWETEMMKQVNTANKLNDDRCRGIPPTRSYPQKVAPIDNRSMSLFPTGYASPPMHYSSMANTAMNYYNHQAHLMAARAAQERAHYNRVRRQYRCQ